LPPLQPTCTHYILLFYFQNHIRRSA
jgi:hypothetical protein